MCFYIFLVAVNLACSFYALASLFQVQFPSRQN